MSKRAILTLKTLLHLLCLAPFAWLLHLFTSNSLANYADPINFITHFTGDWTLNFLFACLAITPIRRLPPNLSFLIRFRRMLGLFAFFYGCLHLTTYLWLDKFFDWSEIVKDITKRPFITAGFTAWVLMLPLALTSTAGAIRLYKYSISYLSLLFLAVAIDALVLIPL